MLALILSVALAPPAAPVRLAMVDLLASHGDRVETITQEDTVEVDDDDAIPAMQGRDIAYADAGNAAIGGYGSTAPQTLRWPTPASGPQSGDRSTASLQTVMLASHAATRRTVGLNPLTWDDKLAAEAGRYARTLAASGAFEHAHQTGTPQGENLWMGTRDAYGFGEMVAGWSDEARAYRHGTFPEVSRTGNFGDVGHYTQMVWRGTRQVGCATASNGENDYLVCRYFPAGNVMGDRAY